jgi:hypothetical protein
VSSSAAKQQPTGSTSEPPLFQNRHFRVELLPGEAIVRVTRLALPFASAEDAMFGCRPMLATLDALGRASHYLLFDSRLAIGRNDPEYESWFAPHRRDLVRDFPKAAVVISTSAGRLHSQRLINADSAAERFRVFDDYVMALAFVRTAFRASSRPGAALPSHPPKSGPSSAVPSSSTAPNSLVPSSVVPSSSTAPNSVVPSSVVPSSVVPSSVVPSSVVPSSVVPSSVVPSSAGRRPGSFPPSVFPPSVSSPGTGAKASEIPSSKAGSSGSVLPTADVLHTRLGQARID